MFSAGLHVVFDVSKPVGRRVRSLDILCTRCRVPRYDPVEDEAVYTVIMPEYLVRGGDGYSVIGEEMLRQSSGEMFVRRVMCCRAATTVFTPRFISLQEIWTSQSCPTTSRRGSRFIQLSKDASRSTTLALDCGDNPPRWFSWSHWCCAGLCKRRQNTSTDGLLQDRQDNPESFLQTLNYLNSSIRLLLTAICSWSGSRWAEPLPHTHSSVTVTLQLRSRSQIHSASLDCPNCGPGLDSPDSLDHVGKCLGSDPSTLSWEKMKQ